MSVNIRGPPTRMGPAPIKGKIIVDTGSGVHIVGKNNIPKQSHPWIQRAQPACLNTANGQINADQSVLIGSQRFRGTIRACVLDNSPNVLSVGQLCNNGWTFHWAGSPASAPSSPILISPDGRQFHLSVRNNVPYLDSNDQLNLYRDKSVGSSNASDPVPLLPIGQESNIAEEQGPATNQEAHENVPFDPISLQRASSDSDPPPEDIVTNHHRNLRQEALSSAHMLTHLPKNPYCASCIRAKMNARQARRRHTQSRTKSFGDIVTADHLIPRDDDGQGIDNDKVALVVKDHFSGWIDIYPAACKSADEVVLALNHFQGTSRSIPSNCSTPTMLLNWLLLVGV